MKEINVKEFFDSLVIGKSTFLFVSMFLEGKKRNPMNCLLKPRPIVRREEETYGLQTDFNDTPEFKSRVNKINKGIGVITETYPNSIVQNEDGTYTFTWSNKFITYIIE